MHDQSRTHTDAADDAPRCVSCHSGIPAWDTPRFACDGCQQRTAQRLGELPSLYAALNPAPGRGAPLVGSRHGTAGSRAPLNLTVVDLTAGASRDAVLPRLLSWVRDWADVGHLEPPPWPLDDVQRVAACCHWLRWHLDWASREHLAVDDFVQEISDVYGHVYSLATGEQRGERPVRLACPCGGVILWRLSGAAYRCPGCGERYGREEAAALPQAKRTVAAA